MTPRNALIVFRHQLANTSWTNKLTRSLGILDFLKIARDDIPTIKLNIIGPKVSNSGAYSEARVHAVEDRLRNSRGAGVTRRRYGAVHPLAQTGHYIDCFFAASPSPKFGASC